MPSLTYLNCFPQRFACGTGYPTISSSGRLSLIGGIVPGVQEINVVSPKRLLLVCHTYLLGYIPTTAMQPDTNIWKKKHTLHKCKNSALCRAFAFSL